MRRVVPALLGLALVALVVVVVLAARDDDAGYRVRAIFDNAGFVIAGEDVKVAGVKVGKVASLHVTDDFKAAIVLDITDPGYQDFRADASCIVRPQGLIGERFVECTPTQPRSAGTDPPPELREVDGERLLPVQNTMQTVDIDLIGNTMREPERARLSLILNELGTGLAGRGRDLNDVIRRANPALQETNKVLAILAEQNTQLEQLAVNGDRILAPLARDRASVAGAIRNSSEVAKATAEKSTALAADIETLPAFLDELKPTMERLGTLADASTPVFAELGANAESINQVVQRLGPFSSASVPAIESLGEAAKSGTEAVTDARPVIADLRALSRTLRPVSRTLREVLSSFDETGGIQRAMEYIFFQATAINGFDALGHYLRAMLIVNQCATYAVEPVPGCSAMFPANASASSARTFANAVDAAGDDPVLRASALALAKALGQEVEKVREEAERKPPKAQRPVATPESVPTVAPETTAVAPVPGDTPPLAVPTETATPEPTATGTPPPDPAEALLDYLFGGGG